MEQIKNKTEQLDLDRGTAAFSQTAVALSLKGRIRDVVTVDPAVGEARRDVYFADGLFAEPFAGPYDLDLAADDLLLLPGLIDAHAHLRDPGLEYRETIKTGTRSAVAGGFTGVASMPNTKPVADNAAVVTYICSKAKAEGYCKVYPIGAVSKGQAGSELAEIGLMKEAGIVAISDDGSPVSTAAMMEKAMVYAADFGLTVIDHCEDMTLAEGSMNEGYNSTRMGVKGIPSAAEDIIVARDLILAEYLKLPVHIAHVSTKGAVAMIRQAKSRGVQVTAETCPHYFALTDDACLGFNTYARVNPPLRQPEDVAAIIAGLADGTIDVIATDHAPHHADEKEVEFDRANNGFVGFETALALGYTYLVQPGHLSLLELVDKMTRQPARLFGLPTGSLKVGRPADFCLFDPTATWQVDRFRQASKAQNSPYQGVALQGLVKLTAVDGKVVFAL